jgi:hypothetical protein
MIGTPKARERRARRGPQPAAREHLVELGEIEIRHE